MANYQSQYTGEQIDEAVAQVNTNTQNISTNTQNIEKNLLRMQGRGGANQNNLYDPILYKEFSSATDATTWLNGYHSSVGGQELLGIIRMNITGGIVHVINTVASYASDTWVQTLLNANIDNGIVRVGTGIYVRESYNGVWGAWRKMVQDTELADRAKYADIKTYMHSGGVLPSAQVYLYNGEPISHWRVVSVSSRVDIIFCIDHRDAEETNHDFVWFTGSHTDGYLYQNEYDEAEGDIVPQWILDAFE